MDARTDTVAVVAVLTAARAIVADPTRWCAWPHALDADGLKREGREKRAVRWGALGALDRVAAESDAAQDSIVKATSLLNRAACEIPGTDPATLQVLDLNPSHIVTLELFDRAIRAAPKPETPGTVHILTIARTLIVHPDRWAQGAIALDRCPQPAGASRRRTRWRSRCRARTGRGSSAPGRPSTPRRFRKSASMCSTLPMKASGSSLTRRTPNSRSGLRSGRKSVCGRAWSTNQPRCLSLILPGPYSRSALFRKNSRASRPQRGPKSSSRSRTARRTPAWTRRRRDPRAIAGIAGPCSRRCPGRSRRISNRGSARRRR